MARKPVKIYIARSCYNTLVPKLRRFTETELQVRDAIRNVQRQVALEILRRMEAYDCEVVFCSNSAFIEMLDTTYNGPSWQFLGFSWPGEKPTMDDIRYAIAVITDVDRWIVDTGIETFVPEPGTMPEVWFNDV